MKVDDISILFTALDDIHRDPVTEERSNAHQVLLNAFSYCNRQMINECRIARGSRPQTIEFERRCSHLFYE